jgi:hypothetical protein
MMIFLTQRRRERKEISLPSVSNSRRHEDAALQPTPVSVLFFGVTFVSS